MELQHPNIIQNGTLNSEPVKDVRFIESNTEAIGLTEIQEKHIIPVFVKDNTPLISQADFITNAREIVEQVVQRDSTSPAIRVSHPIKGRIFDARHKKASELEEYEKTIYYERMAWISEIPSITDTINGHHLTLTYGGVKAYNLDSLNNKYGTGQHFKFFIGFKVKVCTNLCVWTDGFSIDIIARNAEDLNRQIFDLVSKYELSQHLNVLRTFTEIELSEMQFARLLGRTRMYNHLPSHLKKVIPPLLISDSQISKMTKAYYSNQDFVRADNGNINLWNLYNLFTGAVKTSYIDTFLDRNANAFDFINGIASAIGGQDEYAWFLS